VKRRDAVPVNAGAAGDAAVRVAERALLLNKISIALLLLALTALASACAIPPGGLRPRRFDARLGCAAGV
jgi:hypothetical protein